MFVNSILITERDDVSYMVIHCCKKIVLNKNNITALYNTIDAYKNNNNIIIDSRCSEFIIYSFFKYTIDIYIYNVINNVIENVFIWTKHTIKYNINAYNVVYVKKILFLYLFYNHYMKYITSKPFFQPAEAHKTVAKTSSDTIKIDFVLEFINRPYTTNDYDNDVYNIMLSIVNFTNLDNIEPLPKTFTLANIQAVLSMLVSMDYVLKC